MNILKMTKTNVHLHQLVYISTIDRLFKNSKLVHFSFKNEEIVLWLKPLALKWLNE